MRPPGPKPTTEPVVRARAFATIAEAAANDRPAATRAIAEAIKAAKIAAEDTETKVIVDLHYDPDLYVAIAESAAKAGMIDTAMELTGKIATPEAQNRAYAAIAEAAAKAGMIDRAMEAAAKIADPTGRALQDANRMYAAIAEAAAKAGMIDRAMEAAAKIADPVVQPQAYAAIAEAAAKAGMIDRTMKEAVKIIDAIPQAWAFAAIAEAAAKAGMIDSAIQAESRIPVDRDFCIEIKST